MLREVEFFGPTTHVNTTLLHYNTKVRNPRLFPELLCLNKLDSVDITNEDLF